MSWKITFLNQKVEADTLSFPMGILANFLHILEMIEEFGPNIGKPYTAAMGMGLFEIRARGKEGIGRTFYIEKGKEIIVLHSFIKKTRKTPKRELDKARRRMKELK
jgi:phage-related protein